MCFCLSWCVFALFPILLYYYMFDQTRGFFQSWLYTFNSTSEFVSCLIQLALYCWKILIHTNIKQCRTEKYLFYLSKFSNFLGDTIGFLTVRELWVVDPQILVGKTAKAMKLTFVIKLLIANF